ncbi:MAG: CPBP family intramembrane metalloprotease [Ignavibacteriaceae bacterium]|nr:CPBP family intramembrane metalloprotease [Ignavibacteriaceae bacterium]
MTFRFLLEAVMQVSVISVVAIILLNNRSRENFLRIGLFAGVYIVYQIVLVVPRLIPALAITGSGWNWEGKILGIGLGVLCYFLLKRYFPDHDFFTLRQNSDNFRITMTVTVSVILIMSVLYHFIADSPFDIETLAFQLTMPGPDEEIMFRGVLLGLLLSALPDKIRFTENPSVLLTAVLFGFLHAFTLDRNYGISFEPVYFLQTFLGGYVFGWLAVKSRSLVLPVAAHALTNFFAALATML